MSMQKDEITLNRILSLYKGIEYKALSTLEKQVLEIVIKGLDVRVCLNRQGEIQHYE